MSFFFKWFFLWSMSEYWIQQHNRPISIIYLFKVFILTLFCNRNTILIPNPFSKIPKLIFRRDDCSLHAHIFQSFERTTKPKIHLKIKIIIWIYYKQKNEGMLFQHQVNPKIPIWHTFSISSYMCTFRFEIWYCLKHFYLFMRISFM